MRRIFVVAATLALASAAEAQAPATDQQHLVYTISRNGSPIGQHILDIDKKGDMTSVDEASAINVKVLFFSAYTYRYNGHETWSDDQLVAFESQTDDNGTRHSVTVRLSGGRLAVDADGHRSSVPKTTGLDDFWTPKLLSKHTVLDTSDGRVLTFSVQDLGMETITYQGSPKPARHYRLSGGINRDLWFDAGTPVRFQITARDGSTIVSTLQ